MEKRTLAEQAKKAVEYTGRTALGTLTREDRGLIVVPSNQDREVLQAVVDALKEKGISVDVLWDQDLLGISEDDLIRHSAAEGWKELLYFQPTMAEFLSSRAIVSKPPDIANKHRKIDKPLAEYLRKNQQYTAVFAKSGGAGHTQNALQENKHKLRGLWEHVNRQRFLSNFILYPDEIVQCCDRNIFHMAANVAEIRVTDPAGTYFTCPVDEEDAAVWAASQKIAPSSHAIGLPLMGTRLMTLRYLLPPGPIKVPRSNGVIAGTCGHYGFYPHMKAYIRDGWIERIEGGGRMGELLQDIMSRTRDIQFPGFPKPGWSYLNGIAIGTNPKGFRNSEMFDTLELLPNSFDRLRSGVIHWDMGGETYSKEFLKFVEENKLPAKHAWHIHTYFNTYEVRLRGGTVWHKIIDKGRLAALDAPETRALAAQYGNPDEMLKEDWIPKVPGINYPGDYMRNYGNDPAPWVWKELNGVLPETIGVPS
jgi:hypothetical protein